MAEVDFYQDLKKEWRWRITAPNGEIVGASTEGYRQRVHAKNNLTSFPYYGRPVDIRTAATASDPRPEGVFLPLEFYKDKTGEWRWRVTARNGKIVHASTEGYSAKGDAVSNFESLVGIVKEWVSSVS